MEGMLAAEKTCCRSKHGHAWSLKLVRAGKLVRYWKVRKLSVKNKTKHEHLHMLAAFLEVEDDDSLPMSEIDKKLTEARKALKVVQENAAAARDTHLEELSRQRMTHNSGNLAMVIKNMKHCEELKQAFQSMKYITKGITGGVVKELIVPNPEMITTPAMYQEVIVTMVFEHAEPFLIMDDQDNMMLTLIKRNKLHLHQAFDTPFAKKEMQDYIGENRTEKGVKEILEGNFDPNNFDNLPAVSYGIKNNLEKSGSARFSEYYFDCGRIKEYAKKAMRDNKFVSFQSSLQTLQNTVGQQRHATDSQYYDDTSVPIWFYTYKVVKSSRRNVGKIPRKPKDKPSPNNSHR
eukprot:15345912-Ditylum_brightwellii.AAC.1